MTQLQSDWLSAVLRFLHGQMRLTGLAALNAMTGPYAQHAAVLTRA